MKDAIRRRGENISSQEVETALLTHPAVLDCAVYAVPSEMAEDEVAAAVVLKTGAAVDPLDLIKHIEPRLPYFAIPRFVRLMAEVPRTDTQKVKKLELRAEGAVPGTFDLTKSGYKVSR